MTEPAANDAATAKRRQRARNYAVMLGLLLFVAIVYGITIVKIRAGYAP